MFSYFFIKLNNTVSNNLSFLSFLLCWNAYKIVAQDTYQRGCLGPDVKKFSSLLYTYKFFLRNQTKSNVYLFFWFFIVYLPEKNGNWKMAQGCRLSPTIIFFFRSNLLGSLILHQCQLMAKILTGVSTGAAHKYLFWYAFYINSKLLQDIVGAILRVAF